MNCPAQDTVADSSTTVYALYTHYLLLTVLGKKEKHVMSDVDTDYEYVLFRNSKSEGLA
jgi:hypothetical protein